MPAESLKEPALGMKSRRTCISRAAHSDWASLRDSAASAIDARSAQLVRCYPLNLGQFAVTGEPVAVLGGGAQPAVAKAADANQPVLYVEFRKDGIPVDPGPWWAVNEGQEVRG